MGVESGRVALAGAPAGYEPGLVAFATTAPAYADKTNATAIHAALGLPDTVPAFDAVGADPLRRRRGVDGPGRRRPGRAVRRAHRPTRIGRRVGRRRRRRHARVRRRGRHRRGRRRGVGHRGVHGPLEGARRGATRRSGRSASASTPTCRSSSSAVTAALKSSGIALDDIDHVIITGSQARAVKAAARAIGARPETVVDDLAERGRQHRRRPLGAAARRRARPGRARPADRRRGAWPTAATCGSSRRPTCCRRTARPSRSATASPRTNDDLTYPQFLTWRGFLQREPPRRPEPDRPAAPPSARTDAWKYAFVGSRDASGFVYLPPSRVSMGSGDIDQMEQVPMADVRATIATFTVDRLAFSLSPPVVAAIIDFDGGGRFQCELTDVDPASVEDRRSRVDDVPPAVHERRRAQLLLEGDAPAVTARSRDEES